MWEKCSFNTAVGVVGDGGYLTKLTTETLRAQRNKKARVVLALAPRFVDFGTFASLTTLWLIPSQPPSVSYGVRCDRCESFVSWSSHPKS